MEYRILMVVGCWLLARFIHQVRKLQASGDSVSERNARALLQFPHLIMNNVAQEKSFAIMVQVSRKMGKAQPSKTSR